MSSDLSKVATLLKSDAIEKQIAAAIVIGELNVRAPGVAEALAVTLDSGVPLLQCHALEALARIGAKKALDKIFPLLSASSDDVRRAATRAIASVGDDVVPMIKKRIVGAGAEERRALDHALAELGGKDAFGALIAGLASSDPEAAKSAALAVRHEVKTADGRQRKSYLSATEKFLEEQKKKKGPAGAIAAAIKILGYLEDEKTIPTLLAYATNEKEDPIVRQEAIIAFRFALTGAKAQAKVVDALVRAGESPDRTLAQTALHTLASLDAGADVCGRLEKLVSHPDIERARFVMEHIGRIGGAEGSRVLAKALVTLDKRYAEIAANALAGKEEAAPALAKALLDAKDRDRAWAIRNVLRPVAKKVPAALRKQLLDVALDRLSAGELGWEPQLDVVRDADPESAAEALRALAQKLRKGKKDDKALTVQRLLCKSDRANDDDRYKLAAQELGRGLRDTRPAARAGDDSLRLFGGLLSRGYDVAKALKKDRDVSLEDLYYVGFHFVEEGKPLGEELLSEVVKKGGRAKVAKMAKNKLSLADAS